MRGKQLIGIPSRNVIGKPKRFDRHKIDYSSVAAKKSRCIAEIINIAFNINDLLWSGRRDSNPQPSAPKADYATY
jgi:hypothetical protein